MNVPPTNNAPPGGKADLEHGEKRRIGDFDSSANALWTLYGTEAKSHDEVRIHTLKDDMDGVLIFVSSYVVYASAFDPAD